MPLAKGTASAERCERFGWFDWLDAEDLWGTGSRRNRRMGRYTWKKLQVVRRAVPVSFCSVDVGRVCDKYKGRKPGQNLTCQVGFLNLKSHGKKRKNVHT